VIERDGRGQIAANAARLELLLERVGGDGCWEGDREACPGACRSSTHLKQAFTETEEAERSPVQALETTERSIK
jgi:hypothetical protein